MSRRYNRRESNLAKGMNKSVDFGRGKGLDTGVAGGVIKYAGRKNTEIQEESKGQSVYSNMNSKTKSNVHIRREGKIGEEKERGLARERSGNRETDRSNMKREENQMRNRMVGGCERGYEMKLRRPVEIKYFRTLSLPHIDILRVNEITEVSVLPCIHKPSIQIITHHKQASPHITRLTKSSLHKISPRTINISNKRVPKEASPKISPITKKVQNITSLVPTTRSKSVLNSSKSVSPSSQIPSKPKEPLYRKSTNHPITTTYRHSSALVGQRKNTPLKQTVISSISICETARELKESSAEIIEIKASKVVKVDMSVQTEYDVHNFNEADTIVEDPDEDKMSPFVAEKGREENIANIENLREEERNNELRIGNLERQVEQDKEDMKGKEENSIPDIVSQQVEKVNSSTEDSCVDTKLEYMLSFEEFMKITPSSPSKQASGRLSVPAITALSPKSTTACIRYSYLESPVPTLKSPLSCFSASPLKTSDIKIEYETRSQKLQKRNLAANKIQRKYRTWRLSKDSSKQAKKPQLALPTIKYLNKSITNLIYHNKLSQAFRIWKLTVDILRAEVYKKFLSVCATFIQKNWRGYLARKLIKKKEASRIHLQRCLMRFVKGWKVRQIMKSSTVANLKEQIRDLESIIADLKNSNPTKVNLDLMQKMSVQIKAMKRNLSEEVRYLYDIGSWSSMKEIERKKVVYKKIRFQIDQSTEEGSDLQEESKRDSPKIRFSNFLRRNKENYDPLKSILNSSRSQTPQPSFKFEERLSLNYDKSLEEHSEYESKSERKSFNFLKRKSQMIKPTKINWRSNSKIDCWGSPRPKSNRRPYTHTQSLLIDNRANDRVNSESDNPFPLSKTLELSHVPDSPSNRDKSTSFEEIEKQCNITDEMVES